VARSARWREAFCQRVWWHSCFGPGSWVDATRYTPALGDVWIVGWHRLASKMNENYTNSINQLLRSLSSSAKSLLKEFLGSKARPAEVGTSRHFFVRTLEKRVLLIVWRRCWQPPFGHCATTAMGSRAWCFFFIWYLLIYYFMIFIIMIIAWGLVVGFFSAQCPYYVPVILFALKEVGRPVE